jgi:hypothetical protein
MRRLGMSVAVIALVSISSVLGAQGFKNISEFLTGYEETPVPVSTPATGTFDARISKDESQIDWELSYTDLVGAVQQAHIHFGTRGITGGISIWLCGNQTAPGVTPAINPPPGIQPCPPPPATISGTSTAANVVGPAAQGIDPGEFAEVIRAMRAGATYVNVHSSRWPTGEIRSQIDGNSGRGGHSGH